MNGQNDLANLKLTMIRIVAALLLASVVLALSGCQICPTVPASEYRPPVDLMQPAPTQYLLPEKLQKGQRS